MACYIRCYLAEHLLTPSMSLLTLLACVLLVGFLPPPFHWSLFPPDFLLCVLGHIARFTLQASSMLPSLSYILTQLEHQLIETFPLLFWKLPIASLGSLLCLRKGRF